MKKDVPRQDQNDDTTTESEQSEVTNQNVNEKRSAQQVPAEERTNRIQPDTSASAGTCLCRRIFSRRYERHNKTYYCKAILSELEQDQLIEVRARARVVPQKSGFDQPRPSEDDQLENFRHRGDLD